jgi:hypothetical protein
VLGFCDADWGGDLEYKSSTIGFVFMIRGGAISWSSIIHHRGGIHGEHASHKISHMDNKIDDGFRIHGGEKNDGDSMQ